MNYLLSFTNYSLTNQSNIYNTLYATFKILNEDQRDAFVEEIVIHMGKSFMRDFKLYIFQKAPNSIFLTYLTRYD